MRAVAALRRRFDPLAERVPPHLTLIFPFESRLTPAELRAHVEAAALGLAPFSLRMAGITGSAGEYLFLNVKRGNDQLIELRDRLYTGPLRRFLSIEQTFTPHLTVGRVAGPEAFRAALAVAAASQVCIDTEIAALSVYCIEGEGSYHLESEIALT